MDISNMSVDELRRQASLYGNRKDLEIDWTDAFDEMARRLREQEQELAEAHRDLVAERLRRTDLELSDKIKQAESALLECQAREGELHGAVIEVLSNMQHWETDKFWTALAERVLSTKNHMHAGYGGNVRANFGILREALSHSTGSKIMAEQQRLRALMAEAVHDFHGKNILFSSAFLEAAGALEAKHD